MEELMRKLITLSFAILLSVACMGQEKLTLKSRVVDSKTRNDVLRSNRAAPFIGQYSYRIISGKQPLDP